MSDELSKVSNWREIAEDKNHPLHYQNVYDASEYVAPVETFDSKVTAEECNEILGNLWGKFEPTFYQFEWFKFFNQRDDKGRLKKHLDGIAIVHRRAGKSTAIPLCIALPRMLEDRGLYIHAFPSLTQARAAIWNGLGRVTRDPDEQAIPYLELFPKKLWKRKDNHAMTLELVNGSVYRLVGVVGADGTANHLRGLNPIGVICDEYPEWRSGVFEEIFSPILAQNGGFSFKVGTPKGENHAHRDYMYNLEHESDKKRAWLYGIEDTYYNDGDPVITKEYVDELIAKGMDPEIAMQEFYCSFKASASGSYFKHQMHAIDEEGRITHVPHNSNLQTFASLDLAEGEDLMTAVIHQHPDKNTIHIVDNFVSKDMASGQFTDMIRNKYTIDVWFLPWDATKRQDKMDKLQSRAETLRKQKGLKIVIIPKTNDLAGNIEWVQEVLAYCFFDKERCRRLINDLRNYKRKKNAEGVFTKVPVHDKHSHNADAVRCMASAFKLDVIPVHSLQRHKKMIELPSFANYKRGVK